MLSNVFCIFSLGTIFYISREERLLKDLWHPNENIFWHSKIRRKRNTTAATDVKEECLKRYRVNVDL